MFFNLYEKKSQLNTAGLAASMAIMFIARSRRFFQTNAVYQYTEESRNLKPDDRDKPMWSNLGYWKTARTLADASADLARKLGKAADLQQGDRLIDVGCGCAEQDVLWAQEFNVSSIVGLEITPLRVSLAKSRIELAGLNDRIDVRQGSATECPFEDASFSKVIALECAFHFDTRERFFSEAFRLLQPGGLIAVADILPASGRSQPVIKGFLQKLGRRYANIPQANMYDHEEYASKLEKHGFVDVNIESIGDYVFPGCSKYVSTMSKRKDKSSNTVDLEPEDFVAADWLSPWRDLAGLEDYIIVSASKPLSATS